MSKLDDILDDLNAYIDWADDGQAQAKQAIKKLFLEIVNSSRDEYEIRKKVEEL